jgi:diaminopimelate decarboxylase
MTRVMGKRTKKNKTCYHLNDGIYMGFNNVLTDGLSFDRERDQFYAVRQDYDCAAFSSLKFEDCTMFGMTCDGQDIIAKNISAPMDLDVGDWLCFGGMGAYTYSTKTEFNGM